MNTPEMNLSSFQLMIRQAANPMFLIEIDGTIALWNRPAEQLTGYSEVELSELESFRFLLDSDHLSALNHCTESVAEGGDGIQCLKIPIRNKQGNSLITSLSFSKVALENRTLLWCIITDLSGVTEDANVFLKQDQRLREAEVLGKSGYWELDLVRNHLHWSNGIYKIFEIDPIEFGASYEAFMETVHPEDREKVNQAYQDSLISKQAYSIDHRIRLKNGKIKHVSESCDTVFDDAGNPLRSIGSVQDITKWVEINEQLEKERKKFQTLVEHTYSWEYWVGADRQLIYTSSACEQISGYSGEELTENPGLLTEMLYENDRGDYLTHLMSCYQGEREDPAVLQFRIKTKDGNVKWIEHQCRPVLSENGEWIGQRVSNRDITGRKKNEIEIRNLAEKAQAANEAKGTFLANMSHEIRTPLNGIIGITEIMIEEDLSDLQKKQLEMIKSSGTTLLTIINEILDFSKIEAGKISLEAIEFSIATMINELISVFQIKAKNKGVRFYALLDPSIPEYLNGDPIRLKQIITNLVDNALKFTEVGEVNLTLTSLEETADTITLLTQVKDTGIGIPSNKLNLLFQNFSQTDASVTRKYGGTGLGLAITKKLCELMGGEISVQSQENEGTEFRFTIVFKKSGRNFGETGVRPIVRKKVEEATAQTNDFHESNILLVEDNEINRQVALGILKKWNLKLFTAVNGIEALEILKKKKFDLVLMDIQMPEMDGKTATENIRAGKCGPLNQDVSIVAMTAHAMEKEKESCLRIGMSDYLTKPITRKSVFDILNKWLLKNEDQSTPERGNQVESHLSRLIPDDEHVWDFDDLYQLLDGDDQILMTVVNSFIGSMPDELERLEDAILQEDRHRINRQAHSVKGAAGNLRVIRLSELAYQIEANSEDFSKDKMLGIFQKINTEFKKAAEMMQNKIDTNGK